MVYKCMVLHIAVSLGREIRGLWAGVLRGLAYLASDSCQYCAASASLNSVPKGDTQVTAWVSVGSLSSWEISPARMRLSQNRAGESERSGPPRNELIGRRLAFSRV